MIKQLLITVLGLSMLLTHLKTNAQCQATFTCFAFPAGALPGQVILYKKSLTGAQMDSVTYLNVSTQSFTVNVQDSGRYILKYIPSAAGYQISYADTAKSWQSASVYNNTCGVGHFANFFCQPYGTLGGTGNGSLSGRIIEGQKYGQKGTGVSAPGNPIGGIIVKGGKNPGTQLFAQTTTNSNGDYSFTNLPAGDYFVLVDIPGLDTATTHHVTLNNNTVANLGFIVDSAMVVPANDVSVSELNRKTYRVNVFPNPASNLCKIDYSLQNTSVVQINLYDVKGKFLKPIQPTLQQAQGTHSASANIGDLPSGIYFIRMEINGDEVIHKLIKTNP